jgi:hypothetical protein
VLQPEKFLSEQPQDRRSGIGPWKLETISENVKMGTQPVNRFAKLTSADIFGHFPHQARNHSL